MSIASAIIDKFGGTRALARELGRAPTTVQSWKESGVIPSRRQHEILAAARRLNVPLEPSDFFDVPSEAA